MGELLTQTEFVNKLNEVVPDKLKPPSGKFTAAYFSVMMRNGKFKHTHLKGTRKLYDWDIVSPIFNVTVKEDNVELLERASETARDIVESIGINSSTDEILANFEAQLSNRLKRATTSKQEIEIEKMSYEALKKQLESRKEVGTLIDVNDAKSTLEYILGSVKAKFYELPPKLKTRYPQLKDKDITEIIEMVDDIFKDISHGKVF